MALKARLSAPGRAGATPRGQFRPFSSVNSKRVVSRRAAEEEAAPAAAEEEQAAAVEEVAAQTVQAESFSFNFTE